MFFYFFITGRSFARRTLVAATILHMWFLFKKIPQFKYFLQKKRNRIVDPRRAKLANKKYLQVFTTKTFKQDLRHICILKN